MSTLGRPEKTTRTYIQNTHQNLISPVSLFSYILTVKCKHNQDKAHKKIKMAKKTTKPKSINYTKRTLAY